ncbi:MAG TPA: helix-turn-helix domain-containing protein [Gammaproteobacteria bacterium]|nr:helix-turn-helix domain-containing protein [Gammaproteobacteria bacterium]
MHNVAIVVLDEFVPLDVGIPCDVFGRFGVSARQDYYRVRVCAEHCCARSGAFELRTQFGLSAARNADTVLVPGITNPDRPIPQAVIGTLRAAWERGARIASICSGAFVLAAAGLLDGRRATTHWLGTDALARRYPAIDVAPDVLFVDDGRIVTSAGASAGLDMCLHLVRRDYGQAVAAHAARLAVAPLNRDGGQAQFIRHEAPQARDSLAPVLEWMGTHLSTAMDVESLAQRAHMSSRTFARRFREQTGTTPLQWLLTARVRHAQELLETTRRPIEDVALRCGFDSCVTFRTRFRKIVGLSPSAYRLRFNDRRATRPANA